MAMELVSTVTVGSGGAASIEFTNIPQSGKDLIILVSARNSLSSGTMNFSFNGTSSSTNWTRMSLSGTGSAASSASGSDSNLPQSQTESTFTASTFASTEIKIANYASTNQGKSYSADTVQENNATASGQRIQAAYWNDTTAVTSITINSNANNFVEFTTASLYIIS